MKAIYPEKQLGVTAAYAQANYPDDNLLDNRPKKIWRSTTQVTEVTVAVDVGSNAVAIFGTNAVSIALTVKNSAVTGTHQDKISYDLKEANTYFKFFTDGWTSYKSYWIDYTYLFVNHFLILEFESTNSSTSVECGVIKAGPSRGFYEPEMDLREGMVDYSIIRELNNGSWYIRKRDIVKTFSGEVMLERDGDFYVFMRDIIAVCGPNPIAWRVTDYVNNDWTVFARVERMPTATHNKREYSTISFNLVEVI